MTVVPSVAAMSKSGTRSPTLLPMFAATAVGDACFGAPGKDSQAMPSLFLSSPWGSEFGPPDVS